MSDLISLQRRFRRALIDAPELLADLAPDAARRLIIHRTTIEAGLIRTLVSLFPALRRVIGASAFADVAARYIAAVPPRHPVMFTYGREFPPFVSGEPIGASLPYLEDLARLEWARHEAYLAADAPVLDPSRLETADPNAISALKRRLHPATRVISSPFPVHTIWRLNQSDIDDGDIPIVDMMVAENVIVTRPRGEVVTRAICLADAALVRALAGGATLSTAVEAAFAITVDFDVTRALAGHFAAGTFASL